MAYDKRKANAKTLTEATENAITIVATIVASKASAAAGILITPEQLILIGGGIKVLISRLRNKLKHRRAQ